MFAARVYLRKNDLQFNSEYHLIDSEQLSPYFSELKPFYESLSIQGADYLFNLVAKICIECERATYTEGIHVGVQSMEELGE